MEENKLIQTKQAKVNLFCNSVFLSYNELRDLYDFRNIIEKTMYQSDRLSWLYVLGIVPQIIKLDTVLVTKKEKDNCKFWNRREIMRYPKVDKPKYPPEKEKPKQSDQIE
jgi:hypothetical protein